MMKCTICGNTKDNHPFHHPFTPPGEQWVPPGKEKEKSAPLGARVNVIEVLNRLILVLIKRALLSPEDVLYISTGQKADNDRPERSEADKTS